MYSRESFSGYRLHRKMINAQKNIVRRTDISSIFVLLEKQPIQILPQHLRHVLDDLLVARARHIQAILHWQVTVHGYRWVRPQENLRVRKPASKLGGRIILSVVVPNHGGDMRDGLLVLIRPPTKIAAGEGGLRKVRRIRELSVKMQE